MPDSVSTNPAAPAAPGSGSGGPQGPDLPKELKPEGILSAKASKYLWLVYTAISMTVLPTFLFAFPNQPKWLAVAGIATTNVGALLRWITTNSFASPATDNKQ